MYIPAQAPANIPGAMIHSSGWAGRKASENNSRTIGPLSASVPIMASAVVTPTSRRHSPTSAMRRASSPDAPFGTAMRGSNTLPTAFEMIKNPIIKEHATAKRPISASPANQPSSSTPMCGPRASPARAA